MIENENKPDEPADEPMHLKGPISLLALIFIGLLWFWRLANQMPPCE
jgi:hypothetical protein